MPVLCDFTLIQGDESTLTIGEGATSSHWEKKFNTGGRRANAPAMLMLMVKGLTEAKSDARVLINNQKVGVIFRAQGANKDHWFTQLIEVDSGILNDGDNEIEIQAVDELPPIGGGPRDTFFVKNIICFFKQAA